MMSNVIVDVSPSLDGYLAGRDVTVEDPFGDAGFRLHRWHGLDGAEATDADHAAARAMFSTSGAVVVGRTMFEVGIERWGADGAFGLPTFVVTHSPREDLVRGPTTFHFVTDGLHEAIERARTAAGGGDITVAGGAAIVQQCLEAGLVSEMRLHLMPVLLGGGTPLFATTARRHEFELTNSVVTPHATHLTYRAVR